MSHFRQLGLAAVLVLVLALTSVSLTSAEAAKKSLPTAKQWKADVARVMTGSRAWLDDRVAAEQKRKHPRKLAINFDIDNSAIASKYLHGRATPRVYGFAMHAHDQGVALLFNTARVGKQLKKARQLLVKAGYVVDGLCGRTSTKTTLVKGKQKCRAKFAKQGYVLVANVGNRPTDFRGSGYGRAFRLPNYGLRLS
ncbi:MAG: HAD family acid phosphatase [Nocardioidaceae bacterium]